MKQIRSISRIKMLFILIFLFTLFFIISAFGYANTVSAHISDSVFRLHVIANSDSNEDQDLKYLVRDKLIQYMNALSTDVSSKEEAINIAKSHILDFEEIARKVIYENGFDYDVKVEIGNFEFPTKQYGDISFPSGIYDAMKVEIGKAEGKNWWCVMFPPLCFIDVSNGIVPDDSKDIMKEELSNEEFSIISGDSTEVKFKFKILEIFNNVTNILTAKN